MSLLLITVMLRLDFFDEPFLARLCKWAACRVPGLEAEKQARVAAGKKV